MDTCLKREWFKYFEVIDQEDPEYIVGDEVIKHSDLSIFWNNGHCLSVKEQADYSIIVTVGSSPSGKLLVLDVFNPG